MDFIAEIYMSDYFHDIILSLLTSCIYIMYCLCILCIIKLFQLSLYVVLDVVKNSLVLYYTS